MDRTNAPDAVWVRNHLREHLMKLFELEDTSGIELFVLIQKLATLSESAINAGGIPGYGQEVSAKDLSGPRMMMMMRLLGEERMGNLDGLTPTALSKARQVSKNTVSSLLRGLEEQGWIQRNLDPKDYRVFRIQLTQAGREVVKTVAPLHVQRMNEMAAILSEEERNQLIGLLEKLHESLFQHYCKHR